MSLLDDESIIIDNSREEIFKKIGTKIDDFIKKFNFNPNSPSYDETTTIYVTEPTDESLYDSQPGTDTQTGLFNPIAKDSVNICKEISSFSYIVFRFGSWGASSFMQWISTHYGECPETSSIENQRYKNWFAKLIKRKDPTSPYGWYVTVLGDGVNHPILLSDFQEDCLPEYLIFKKYDMLYDPYSYSYSKLQQNEKSEKQLIVLQNCNPELYKNLRNHEYLTPMTLQEYVRLKNECKYEC
jgi:hypothetical protein